jgi:hypothetical protein
VISPVGEEMSLVDGPAAGADGDRLLGGEVVEEHVVLRLVEGEAAGVDVGKGAFRAGGGEILAGLLGVGAVCQEVAAVPSASRCH